MKHYSPKLLACLAFLLFGLLTTVSAQETPERKEAPEKKEAAETPEKVITVGSHVLKQDGTDEYCYNNGPYHYEKVWEVPGVSKDELYARAKKWILSNLKAGDQNQFDDKDKNEIHTATVLIVPENIAALGITNETVNFKLNFYFKEGKYRLEAVNFVYEAIALNTNVNGEFSHLKKLGGYHIANKYLAKIYDSFDGVYLTLIRSLKEAMKKDASGNW